MFMWSVSKSFLEYSKSKLWHRHEWVSNMITFVHTLWFGGAYFSLFSLSLFLFVSFCFPLMGMRLENVTDYNQYMLTAGEYSFHKQQFTREHVHCTRTAWHSIENGEILPHKTLYSPTNLHKYTHTNKEKILTVNTEAHSYSVGKQK